MFEVLFPFGVFSGMARGWIPSADLEHTLDTTRLSSGLAWALRGELAARGRPYSAGAGMFAGPSRSGGVQCWCGSESFFPSWRVLPDGQRVIEGTCTRCGASVERLPLTPSAAAAADRAAYGSDRHDWKG
jgi:hypothetical protein